jgi:hypothetical protein
LFEFFGGPRDGDLVVATVGNALSEETERLCAQTCCGTIGHRIVCPTRYAETIL